MSSQNSYCIVWRCTLRYYSVVGWSWLHSNTIHRDIDIACCKNRVVAFLIQDYLHPVQISDLTSTKATPNHFLHYAFGRWCQVLLQHLDMCLASHKCSSLWSKDLKISFIHHLFCTPIFLCPTCGFFATLPRRPASYCHLFTVDVVTGFLWVPFNEASS